MDTFQKLKELAVASGVVLSELALKGTMFMEIKNEEESISGIRCHRRQPAIRDVLLVHGTEVVAFLLEGELGETAKLLDYIEKVSSLRRFVYKIPYSWDRLYAIDDPKDNDYGPKPMEVPFGFLVKVAEIDAEFFSLIGRDKMGELRRNRYCWYSLSDYFQKNPCSFELYNDLANEYAAAGITGLSISDYINWYFKSLDRLVDGKMNEGTLAMATQMMVAWVNSSIDQCKSSMCRNLEIHPRHDPIYHAFVEEFRRNIGEE